jgi:hypothetical protein
VPALRGIGQSLLHSDALEDAALQDLRQHEQSARLGDVAEIRGGPVNGGVGLEVAGIEGEDLEASLAGEVHHALLGVCGLGCLAQGQVAKVGSLPSARPRIEISTSEISR